MVPWRAPNLWILKITQVKHYSLLLWDFLGYGTEKLHHRVWMTFTLVSLWCMIYHAAFVFIKFWCTLSMFFFNSVKLCTVIMNQTYATLTHFFVPLVFFPPWLTHSLTSSWPHDIWLWNCSPPNAASSNNCENDNVKWEIVHCYPGYVDCCYTWSEHAVEVGLLLSLESQHAFSSFVFLCNK